MNSEAFIDSIRATTKKKSEMKFPNYSRSREWRTLHQRTKEIVNTLIRISEHLERIEMNKTTVEVTSYLSCASSLTKIIPGMLENLTKHFVREKVYFCKSPPKPMYLTKLNRKEEKKMKNDTTSIQVPLPVVVKTEPIEIVAVRKSLRKSEIIPEKEASENVMAYLFVPERENFCESLSSKTSEFKFRMKTTLSEPWHACTRVQEEDNNGRKDAADHTAKQYKLTSAGASSMPVGLTPRPDPNRTQQGQYAEAGPQLMSQDFWQPPPMVPNPPPIPQNLPPFQQHQAAARYLEKLPLTVNYNGIPKL
jgi:hypothetical protein